MIHGDLAANRVSGRSLLLKDFKAKSSILSHKMQCHSVPKKSIG